jgi:hypothetical protein
MGPLLHLKHNFKINGEAIILTPVPTEDTWVVYRDADILFMQRPSSPEHLIALEQAKMCGLKVWVDYDDNYFAVTNDNPMYSYYNEDSTKARVSEFISKADVVSVSTKNLAEVYKDLNDNIKVIPNAFDEQMFNNLQVNNIRQKRIVWRGTQIHRRGLDKYTDSIISVSKDNPEWEWHFIGDSPWKILDSLPADKVFAHNHIVNIPNYFKFLFSMEHSIQIVCGTDNDFFKAKSNIAWMEASLSGATTLAPNSPEWIMPGCTNYSNEDEFKASLHNLIKEHETNFNKSQEAMGYIKSNLLLKDVNKQRLSLLKNLR